MTANLLDLNKSFVLNLDKAGISSQNIPTMEVRLAIDKSGSMAMEFNNGFVDSIVNRFLGVAMSFDDNGSVEVGFFNHAWHDAPEAVPDDIGNYLRKSGERADGGTAFADIISNFETGRPGRGTPGVAAKAAGFLGKLFGGSDTPAQPATMDNPAGCEVKGMRAYVGIVTDGENNDKREFEAQLAATSGEVFYQFICIGNGAPTDYLQRIARQYPHVSMVHFPNPNNISEDEFYGKLVNPTFTAWMATAK